MKRFVWSRLGNSCIRVMFVFSPCRVFFLMSIRVLVFYKNWNIFPLIHTILRYSCFRVVFIFLSVSCRVFFRILIIFAYVSNSYSCRLRIISKITKSTRDLSISFRHHCRSPSYITATILPLFRCHLFQNLSSLFFFCWIFYSANLNLIFSKKKKKIVFWFRKTKGEGNPKQFGVGSFCFLYFRFGLFMLFFFHFCKLFSNLLFSNLNLIFMLSSPIRERKKLTWAFWNTRFSDIYWNNGGKSLLISFTMKF